MTGPRRSGICRRCGNTGKVLDAELREKVDCPECKRAPGPTQNFQLAWPPKKRWYSATVVHVIDRRTSATPGPKPTRTMCGDEIDETWEMGRNTVKEPWNDATCPNCVDKLRGVRTARLSLLLPNEEKEEL